MWDTSSNQNFFYLWWGLYKALNATYRNNNLTSTFNGWIFIVLTTQETILFLLSTIFSYHNYHLDLLQYNFILRLSKCFPSMKKIQYFLLKALSWIPKILPYGLLLYISRGLILEDFIATNLIWFYLHNSIWYSLYFSFGFYLGFK